MTDLEEIGDFIEARDPGRAHAFLEKLTDHCRKIATAPKIRPAVAHLEGRALRKALFGNYRMYYGLLSDDAVIESIHIRHASRRDPEF